MVRMNDNYQDSDIKVRLFKHSTNTISQNDAKLSNSMENKVQLRSLGELVIDQLHCVLVDNCDEYEMMSMVNRYLVNWNIASFRCTKM